MQSIDHDGRRGPITAFDKDGMIKMLKDSAVKEVGVFNTPPPDDQAQTPPVPKQQPPKVIEGFLLQKGMKINLHGTLYKVVTARPNGKVAMKFIRFIEGHERSSI